MSDNKPLGFRPGPVSDSDWPLHEEVERKMSARRVRRYGTQFWSSPNTLNQWTGSCVGHGAIQVYNSSPTIHSLTDDDAMRVYDLAQRKYDEFDDTPPEEGTSVRAGAMAMRELGLWRSFAMGYAYPGKEISLTQLALWLLNNGPFMMGINWLEGFENPNTENHYSFVMEGQERGGHNIEVDGVVFENKPDTDRFRVHQSWGDDYGFRAYGHGGFAWVPWLVMEEIMRQENTAVCSPVELERR